MRPRDTADVLTSALAVVADAIAIFAGFLAAIWLRFFSGLIPLFHDRLPPRLWFMYGWGAAIATLLFLFIYGALGLYVRPQVGAFANRVPRLIRGTGLGILLSTVLAFAVGSEPPFSRLTIALAFFTVLVLVLAERALLYRAEILLARHSRRLNRVLILGTDEVAAHLRRGLEREPLLRSTVVGFLRTREGDPDPGIPAALIQGGLEDLSAFLDREAVDQVILTDSALDHPRLLRTILECEQRLVTFNMVPDLFRIMTGSMDIQTVDDIPLLGAGRWPLDRFWNRILKRLEDLVGALLLFPFALPVIAVAAILIRRSSPGPVFYRQERCGEHGKPFIMYKLRTMVANAEQETGPVWAVKDDPRRTRVGAFLRRHSLDELPQLWNVLKGEMSLVGPRPERRHFVEQFKEDISGYMWRHACKPGMTGWAQVNGLRGNTSIEQRIRYDLYYLENWSLAFDLKILLRTLLATKTEY